MALPHHIFAIYGMILSVRKDILTFIKRMIKQALPKAGPGKYAEKENDNNISSSCIFSKHFPGHQ